MFKCYLKITKKMIVENTFPLLYIDILTILTKMCLSQELNISNNFKHTMNRIFMKISKFYIPRIQTQDCIVVSSEIKSTYDDSGRIEKLCPHT